MKDWFLNLISSPGFWRGVTYFTMAAGVKLAPEQENSIIAGGLAVAGLIHSFAAAKSK